MFGTTGPAIHGREFMNAMSQLGVQLELFPPATPLYYLFQRTRDSKKLGRIKHLRNLVHIIEPSFVKLISLKKWITFLNGDYDFVIARTTDFSINLLHNFRPADTEPLILEVNSIISGNLADKHKKKSLSYVDKLRGREILLLKRAKAIYVVSEGLTDDLIESGIRADGIYVIPNGVDAKKFNPHIKSDKVRDRYNLRDKIVVGFLGEVRHGHDMTALVEGFSMASKDVENLILFIVGPNKSFLQKTIDQQKLNSKVIITGRVEHGKIPSFISAFDIAVSPIKYLYYCPLKNFEYMAMAKPIVATNLMDTTAMLKNGISAILIEPYSSNAMCNAILKLAKDEEFRNKIGEEARKIVLERFTWRHNAEKVLHIIPKQKSVYKTSKTSGYGRK
jgi:glycosyltransferase involved in cell wall biosynthesis